MPYPVRYLHSDMVGAPTLFGAGTMIALLDACLLNGFNLVSLDSLTYNSGANEVTGTVASGHGFDDQVVIAVSGANEPEYNGDQQIRVVDANTFTYTPAAAPSGAATGTLQAKVAALDGAWTKPFSGTDLAAYQTGQPEATGLYLRIDDTDAYNAQVRGYEAMTGIDTHSGPFPSMTQHDASSYVWRRTNNTDQGTYPEAPWVLIGDDVFFYLAVAWYVTNGTYQGRSDVYCFGDFPSYLGTDSYNCLILASYSETPSFPGHVQNWCNLSADDGKLIARSYDQMTKAVNFSNSGSSISSAQGRGGGAYPSPVSGGLHLHRPVLIHEPPGAANPIRGILPGVFHVIQDLPLTHQTVLENVTGASGKRILLVASAYGSNDARSAFDITGPWR